jgi:hypothetical protein
VAGSLATLIQQNFKIDSAEHQFELLTKDDLPKSSGQDLSNWLTATRELKRKSVGELQYLKWQRQS